VVGDQILFALGSIITALSNWTSWHFVWRHEDAAIEGGKRKASERVFWFLFSYLLPFLPLFFVMLGSTGSGVLGPALTKWSLAILCALLGFLMSGLAMSSWSWYRKNTSGRLPEQAMKNFIWTMSLTTLAGIWWLVLLLWRVL